MRTFAILSAILLLPSCGSEPAAPPPSAQTQTKPKEVVDITSAERCPFAKTSGWYAQIERGRFSVDGQVDFTMAGFKPALAKRAGAPAGEVAFDLSLASAPGGAVDSAVAYEERPGIPYRRVTVYCGGEQVAAFDPIDQRL